MVSHRFTVFDTFRFFSAIQPIEELSQAGPLHGAHLDTLPGVQLRADIKVEAWSGLAIWSSGIEVDHVVHTSTATVDDPVVSIEGRLVAQDGVEPGSRGHALHLVGKGLEFRAAASRRQLAYSSGE